MEIIQMITTQWMDKENMVYPYKGLLFNNRKRNANKHYNIYTHTHTKKKKNTTTQMNPQNILLSESSQMQSTP